MDLRILSAQNRIDSLEAKAKSDPVRSDVELQAQLARFLCVLSSGLIEQATVLLLDAYARRRSGTQVASYVSSQLSRLQNTKFDDILTLLGRFDSTWREYFISNTPPEQKDAIDSIVNNRNQIAHGGQVGISLGTFSEYYRNLKLFIISLDAFVSGA